MSDRKPGAEGGQAGLGRPISAAWREEAITRVIELEGLAARMRLDADATATIKAQLERARPLRDERGWRLQSSWRRFKRTFKGASLERTLGSLDAVEADLLSLAPDEYVCGLMPSLKAHVNRYLPKDDPRRLRLEPLLAKAVDGELTPADRIATVAAYHAANSQRRRELLRLRTFRNVLLIAAVLLMFVGVGLGILGSLRPDLLPLCFAPTTATGLKVVCPTEESKSFKAAALDIDKTTAETVSPWDLWLVEIIGLVAAGVASAFALRGMRGTSTPYGLPVALAALKLATGALTAFLGLLLMRGGFVPGLSALDSSAQILSWAIVFGYAQQLFTRFVDQQANNVLESVGGRGAAGDRPLTQRAA
jgi:hypothetical protein